MSQDEPLFESQIPFVRGMVQRLRSRPSLPPLRPEGPWNKDITDTLTQIGPADAFSAHVLTAPEYARALWAGLLLWNDDLAEAHTLAQGIDNSTGRYWHGIMHRREGDFSNSKHWFEETGAHPILETLGALVEDLLGRVSGDESARRAKALRKAGRWDPVAFVDWCEAAAQKEPRNPLLESIQLYEMALLLAYAEARALGKGRE